MQHATITQLENGKYQIIPDDGYVVMNTLTRLTYSEVICDDTRQYVAVEKGSEPPTPTPPAPTPEDELERAKQRKIAQINAYDKSESVNSFTLGGQKMWLTVEEREQIATQISANEAVGRNTMTRWFGGHEFTFPLATWKQMLVALEVYAGDALNVTESHKAAVMALENVEAVEAFDITEDYPPKLNF